MPYVNITLSTPHELAVPDAAAVARQVAALTTSALGKDPAVTAVAVSRVAPEAWFIAGRSLAELGQASFWLDVKVTQGTNTKAELAAFHQAVFQAMTGLLGGVVHPESYVLVHEVPAASYGYGGLTQEYRFVAAQLPTGRDAA